MKYAHYFKSGKKHFLIISTDARPVGQQIAISGKREARTVAAANAAKPYNF